jgi:hypothetical protein
MEADGILPGQHPPPGAGTSLRVELPITAADGGVTTPDVP